jgi:hypothetical protein
MRKLKLTLTVDADLHGLLEKGAARDKRSLSNHAYRLLDHAVRETAAGTLPWEPTEASGESIPPAAA